MSCVLNPISFSLICCWALWMMPLLGYGQKFGYFDSEVLLAKLPEYQTAQKQLDSLAQKWSQEVAAKQKQATEMAEKLLAEEVMLTPKARTARQTELRQKEQEMRQLQEKYFGYDGLLFQKRESLTATYQTKVLEAVAKACRKNRLEYLFDKASSVVIIYANTQHNYTTEVEKFLFPEEAKKKEEEAKEAERNGEVAEGPAKKEPELLPAERLGYIESEAILAKMPEYKDVNTEMERLMGQWDEKLTRLKWQLDSLRTAYDQEKFLLTTEMKEEKTKKIADKEKEWLGFQNEIYGPEGQIFSKRLDLMKPLQEKIFENAQKVAEEKGVSFIFDKTSDVTIAYANPIYNFTDYVLEALGLGDPEDTVR